MILAGSKMTYGIDLRDLVVNFVSGGGSKAEAARRFQVSIWCIKDWCKRGKELAAKPHPSRRSKIDMEKLRHHLNAHNDAILRERAVEFGVTEQAIWYALRRIKATNKKNDAL